MNTVINQSSCNINHQQTHLIEGENLDRIMFKHEQHKLNNLMQLIKMKSSKNSRISRAMHQVHHHY